MNVRINQTANSSGRSNKTRTRTDSRHLGKVVIKSSKTTVEIGAGNETRTRDFHLGKVVLYQLSYSRFALAYCLDASATEPRILAYGGYVSIVLVDGRTVHSYVAITDPGLSERFFCKNCFENLAIADSWDIIKIPKQLIRR